MSIQHERPSPRRITLSFDKDFLDMLPKFKRGFGEGNELGLVVEGMALQGHPPRSEIKILDVGSADGDWLKKMTDHVRNFLGLTRVSFTALEPVSENPRLSLFCKESDVRWVQAHLEEAEELEEESFDIITSTHCAYYYYNQPLAHEQLYRLLKPEGKLIVTLVSQFCVLNHLTEHLLTPHKQFALNAESYMSMMAKLGLFTLEQVRSFKGQFLPAEYVHNEEHLKSLVYILARHRLRPTEISGPELNPFAAAVERVERGNRVNRIMYFEKARLGPLAKQDYHGRAVDPANEIQSLRAKARELAAILVPEKQEVLVGYLDAFAREATNPFRKNTYFEELGNCLVQIAYDAQWPAANKLRERVDRVTLRVLKPG